MVYNVMSLVCVHHSSMKFIPLFAVVVPDSSGFGLGGHLGGIPGLEALGMGSANFMEMQQRMQRELTGNPELMRNLMDNPAVSQLMSDPNIVRSLFEANPQMRELMEVIVCYTFDIFQMQNKW